MPTTAAERHDGGEREERAVPRPVGGDADRREPRGGGTVGDLVGELQRIAAALPAYRPDPADGLVWAYYDSALSGLYGAILALGEVQRFVGAGTRRLASTDGPAHAGRAAWSGVANGDRTEAGARTGSPPAVA